MVSGGSVLILELDLIQLLLSVIGQKYATIAILHQSEQVMLVYGLLYWISYIKC